MELDPAKSARWTLELRKQWIRGKNVLLHGSVFDRFLVNGVYRGVSDFVSEFLRGVGYEVVVEYDPVDNFRSASPEMMAAFNSIVQRRSPQPVPGGGDGAGRGAAAPVAQPSVAPSGRSGSPTTTETPPRRQLIATGPQASPPRAAPAATPGAAAGGDPPRSTDNLSATFEAAFRNIRELLRQPERPAAVLVYFGDQLVGNPKQQSDPERRALMALMKALHESAVTEIAAGVLKGRKNLLVLVAANLESVPEWLLRDNPFLELVEITHPSIEERMDFVRGQARAFHGGPELVESRDQLERVALDFANLTDGFSWWDLDAVRRASAADTIPLGRTKELLDFYKYGQRDDPWERLNADRIRESHAALLARVIGQDHAIGAVVRMIKAAKEGVTMSGGSGKEGRPKGVFFFVGPTGVGKTELAKALTALIFSDETAFCRFDMSEYAESHAAEKLAGAPPGYIGYDEGGQLTNRVRTRPFSLLLFDEIEKAHPRVLDKFLQILEDGRLTDGKGRTTYFSQTVIIFTSNIGAADIKTGAVEKLPEYSEVESHFRRAVEHHFRHKIGRPEIFSRLGENVLVFDILRPHHISQIYGKFMHLLARSLLEKRQKRLAFPDDSLQAFIVTAMQQRDHLAYGGRRIRALLEDLVEKPLNAWLFDNPDCGPEVAVTVSDNQVRFNPVL